MLVVGVPLDISSLLPILAGGSAGQARMSLLLELEGPQEVSKERLGLHVQVIIEPHVPVI